jgi:hypothetical protein
MKIQNWLIYNLTKSVLFFAAVLSALIIPVELYLLITGRTIDLGVDSDTVISMNKVLAVGYDRVMLFVPALLICATVAYVCWQFGMMLDSIQKGNEFNYRNYKRLFHASAAIIIVDILLLAFDMLNNNLVRKVFNVLPTKAVGLSQDENAFSFTWLIAGCLLMMLAKVFRRGAELKEDQDLTF